MCEFCQNHEQGDTLYEPSDWDGGIGFDYIRDIKYCPLCGSLLDGEAKDEPTISKMEQVEQRSCDTCKNRDVEGWKNLCLGCTEFTFYEPKDEPQTIRCPKCGRSDYIREFGKDFSVTAEKAGFKYKCINCNTYIEPQIERTE